MIYFSTGLDSSREDWDRVLGVNVIGYSNMVQACYPFMKKGKLSAHPIESISSESSRKTSQIILKK